MAIGIDSVALAGALSAGKSVVAVTGSGIDICYPSGHLTLAREIVKEGCVLTEYAPGTPPGRFNFPKRNRIISGLSAATLVIEGKEKSGALITARYAKEQGRTVYAVPGNVGSPNSEVTNLLIKNGARLCTCADDIVKDFDKSNPGVLNPFALKNGISYDVMAELSRYSVIAVCPNDDIFTPPRAKKKVQAKTVEKSATPDVQNEPGDDFDPRAIALYKKIPSEGSCPIESLVDDNTSLREVMKLLLKLEVGKFIVMLPGDCVARKA
jgi:predicted Rossmann fold nucleotide-binding protein DprA/Smf involved in DNA uptake